ILRDRGIAPYCNPEPHVFTKQTSYWRKPSSQTNGDEFQFGKCVRGEKLYSRTHPFRGGKGNPAHIIKCGNPAIRGILRNRGSRRQKNPTPQPQRGNII